ncbi:MULTISPECIES: DUF1176 domain-containing protein [unclassified Pseudomonas]|uniref:DUF1176 domain-containing protein n=1 Tax=unclassified Pseudomonas TaxID=196821 RepID=UPI000BCD788A|nr:MULTISPECIES: DUF1176 domain-containing protein [unclassified Pseudomonas]PVZ10440.1 uncharacterized protein DUF1176 [Pseudomonas sp. URIL14HWK12:I12]PVZ21866.1 uncharacterized protein DUF1176 [Pseudomonas sp. URIL14HWK12:I10]PVZ31051.1 uncharacterized protein DUF1176 [Pseudomonas sp. URIL14HWK12:I11]SNZ17648.1 Protein of unknown function [Pseudomonas sp. URIL14HWK12:I9]
MPRIPFALLLALAANTAVAANEPPLYSTYKDWLIGCDNTRTCTAIGAVQQRDDTGHATFSLRISREAGPEGALRIGVFDTGAAKAQPLLDGKPLNTAFGPGELHEGDVPEQFAATGSQAMALIRELRDGHNLVLRTQDGQALASLSGMSAALLQMDAVQGRVGTQTALLRPGDKPTSDVPAAPAAPSLPAWHPAPALNAATAQRLGETVIAATRADWENTLDEGTPAQAQAYALNASQALVLIKTGCAAYNCTYSLYLAPLEHPEQARKVDLPQPTPVADDEPGGDFSFDPARGELTSEFMAMGMGGCGTSIRWRFDGSGFALADARQMSACMGLAEAYWPVLWRTSPSR